MNISLFSSRSLRSLLLGGSLLAVSACATSKASREFPSPGAGWSSSVGQLQYTSRQRSVIGEAVVSRQRGDDFQLDFTAGPGVPLMRLRETGTSASAEGVFARGSWQGDPSHAHGPLASWMALREAFAAVDTPSKTGGKGAATAHSAPGAASQWTARASAGQPRRVTVQFPQTGERFSFVFSK